MKFLHFEAYVGKWNTVASNRDENLTLPKWLWSSGKNEQLKDPHIGDIYKLCKQNKLLWCKSHEWWFSRILQYEASLKPIFSLDEIQTVTENYSQFRRISLLCILFYLQNLESKPWADVMMK